VLGVALLIVFWAILGLGTFFIAMSGGLRGARDTLQSKSRSGGRPVTLVLLILYAGFGLAIPITLLTGNHANASSQFDGVKLNASDKRGRILFGQHCATCHTLSAANATGKVGPNLDVLQPPKALVLSTIQNGMSIGRGTMPQGLVAGRDANDVANFVSTVAGK
jgi:hypothetical protein